MPLAVAALLFGFLFHGTAQAAAQCTPGYQPRGDVCVSQRMSDYIACVESAGGNQQELNQDIANVVNNSSSGSASANGSGVIIKGGGSVRLDRNAETSLSSTLSKKYYSGAMAYCKEALPDLPKSDPTGNPLPPTASNPTLIGGIAIGSAKSILENDNRVQFFASNGVAYGSKPVTLTLGRGLSQTSVGFQAFYYYSANAVTAVTLARTEEDTNCTSPLETTPKLILDYLIRNFGPPSDGPIQASTRSFPPPYESVEVETTKYMFSSGNYSAYLTIIDKVAYRRNSSSGNQLTCRLEVVFQPS